jgi:hypothetical protein
MLITRQDLGSDVSAGAIDAGLWLRHSSITRTSPNRFSPQLSDLVHARRRGKSSSAIPRSVRMPSTTTRRTS